MTSGCVLLHTGLVLTSTSNCEVFTDVYASQVLHFKSKWLPPDASQGRNLWYKPKAGPGVYQSAPSLLWVLIRGWSLYRTKWHAWCHCGHCRMSTVPFIPQPEDDPSTLAALRPLKPGLQPWLAVFLSLPQTPPTQLYTVSFFHLLIQALCFGFSHTNS